MGEKNQKSRKPASADLDTGGHVGLAFGPTQTVGGVEILPVGEVIVEMAPAAAGEEEDAGKVQARVRVVPRGYIQARDGVAEFTGFAPPREAARGRGPERGEGSHRDSEGRNQRGPQEGGERREPGENRGDGDSGERHDTEREPREERREDRGDHNEEHRHGHGRGRGRRCHEGRGRERGRRCHGGRGEGPRGGDEDRREHDHGHHHHGHGHHHDHSGPELPWPLSGLAHALAHLLPFSGHGHRR